MHHCDVDPVECLRDTDIEYFRNQGYFEREWDLILELTDEWNDGAVKNLIAEMKARHQIEDE